MLAKLSYFLSSATFSLFVYLFSRVILRKFQPGPDRSKMELISSGNMSCRSCTLLAVRGRKKMGNVY